MPVMPQSPSPNPAVFEGGKVEFAVNVPFPITEYQGQVRKLIYTLLKPQIWYYEYPFCIINQTKVCPKSVIPYFLFILPAVTAETLKHEEFVKCLWLKFVIGISSDEKWLLPCCQSFPLCRHYRIFPKISETAFGNYKQDIRTDNHKTPHYTA